MHNLTDKIAKLKPGMVAVLGLPYDEQSSFMRGSALAPQAIRDALHSSAGNLCLEDGRDLKTEPRWQELGDLAINDGPEAFDQIEKGIAAVLERDANVLALGGDHAVTLPALRAYGKKYPNLNVLQFDAHPDLYDELDGNRYSHATPMLRALEEKLIGRLVQVGIRTMTTAQREQAKRHSVETIEMRSWQAGVPLEFDGPVYITLDMDCLDPAFAPGVSHFEPGGFSTRDVLGIIQNLKAAVIGADIVEFNPKRDGSGMTATVAAKLVKEIVGKMLL